MSESLAFTAAACQLAREIFMARKAAYDTNDAWLELSPTQKEIFVRQAADVIRAHAPIRSKVIGSISEAEPSGDTHV